jgi:general secretion pathway protein B
LLSDLPAELRSQIPKITITGSVYSDSPAQRLLLVNNLVLTQGSQITPDLKLEEIQPRSSVFSFKGTRFRVMH